MRDQRGQATAEYILVLSFSVVLFITIFKGVLAPILRQAQTKLTQSLTRLYSGDNLHRLNFKVPK